MTTILIFTLILIQVDDAASDAGRQTRPDPHLQAAALSLANALESDDKHIQMRAIHALDAIGEYARPVIPLLVQHVRKNIQHVRKTPSAASAIRVLAKFGSDARAINPTLVQLLERPEGWWSLDTLAQRALVDIGPDPDTVPLLLDVVRSGDRDACRLAIFVLGSYGEVARCSAPLLVKLLKHQDPILRYGSARALGCIGRSAVPALMKEFRETKVKHVREACIFAIGRIGPDAVAAESLLEDALTDVAKEDEFSYRLIKDALMKVREKKVVQKR